MKPWLAHAVLFFVAPALAALFQLLLMTATVLRINNPIARQRIAPRVVWILDAIAQVAVLAAGGWVLEYFGVTPSRWFVIVLLLATMRNDFKRISTAIDAPARSLEVSHMVGDCVGIIVGGLRYFRG